MHIKSNDMTWATINEIVKLMFTRNYGTIERSTSKIHFYGNDGVCLFKYFVKQDDPQKLFVWATLTLNLVCFLIIAGCYTYIYGFAKKSTQTMNKFMPKKRGKMTKRHHQTQKTIAYIICTDFLCWVRITLNFYFNFYFSYMNKITLTNNLCPGTIYSGLCSTFLGTLRCNSLLSPVFNSHPADQCCHQPTALW